MTKEASENVTDIHKEFPFSTNNSSEINYATRKNQTMTKKRKEKVISKAKHRAPSSKAKFQLVFTAHRAVNTQEKALIEEINTNDNISREDILNFKIQGCDTDPSMAMEESFNFKNMNTNSLSQEFLSEDKRKREISATTDVLPEDIENSRKFPEKALQAFQSSNVNKLPIQNKDEQSNLDAEGMVEPPERERGFPGQERIIIEKENFHATDYTEMSIIKNNQMIPKKSDLRKCNTPTPSSTHQKDYHSNVNGSTMWRQSKHKHPPKQSMPKKCKPQKGLGKLPKPQSSFQNIQGQCLPSTSNSGILPESLVTSDSSSDDSYSDDSYSDDSICSENTSSVVTESIASYMEQRNRFKYVGNHKMSVNVEKTKTTMKWASDIDEQMNSSTIRQSVKDNGQVVLSNKGGLQVNIASGESNLRLNFDNLNLEFSNSSFMKLEYTSKNEINNDIEIISGNQKLKLSTSANKIDNQLKETKHDDLERLPCAEEDSCSAAQLEVVPGKKHGSTMRRQSKHKHHLKQSTPKKCMAQKGLGVPPNPQSVNIQGPCLPSSSNCGVLPEPLNSTKFREEVQQNSNYGSGKSQITAQESISEVGHLDMLDQENRNLAAIEHLSNSMESLTDSLHSFHVSDHTKPETFCFQSKKLNFECSSNSDKYQFCYARSSSTSELQFKSKKTELLLEIGNN